MMESTMNRMLVRLTGNLNRVVFALFMLASVTMVTSQQEPSVVFTQEEEQKVGEFVGSVATSPNILDMVGEDDRDGLRYSILTEGYPNSNLFSVDTVSGNVTFAGVVDREDVCPLTDSCEINFGVAVSGSGSGPNFFSTILVKVVITDLNDNQPEFPAPSSVTLEISESASVNTSHPLVTATDADRSLAFGVNSYAIVPESDVFRVELTRNLVGTPQLSLILKQNLDRESKDFHRLSVVAKDGGNPAKSGTLIVNIEVEDFNDNDPLFSQTYYTANFSENAGAGYEIIQVSASDKDIGDNGRILYTLSSVLTEDRVQVKDKISVDNVSGSVTLNEALSSGEYRILIDVYDLGSPRKSNQAVVIATALDTDNNRPNVRVNPVQVGDLPLGWVSEGSDVSTVVAVLSVEDPDSGKNGNVSCECLDEHFRLQQLQTGSYKLMVAKELNREINVSHEVSVTCKDQGSPSLNATTTITIRVFDENDNNPVFSRPMYTQNLVENNMQGDTITVVNALDADDGDNAAVEYRLANTGGNFTITRTSGVIKANRVFDREERSSYQFSVLAVDFGTPRRTGVASVTVNIIDTNDEIPKFSKESYTFHIYENRDAESVVGNISVHDPDLGESGVVSLDLVPVNENDDVPFAVSPEGRISSLESFDREERDSYTFYVVGTDNGQRKLSSSAQIVVQILDVNDNHPTFVFPSEQNFSAYVNIPIESDDTILQVDVYDDDSNKNSIIAYTIESTNASDLFRIGKFNGEIIANKKLDTLQIGTYSVTINATDQGSPIMWEARTLHLVVQSESARTDEVIADQNVLIVACIVCFTVIVSGAVLVAMCVLRRLDRQRKLQYASSCCPGNRPESDSGSTIGDGNQQYDLAPPASKESAPAIIQSSPFHQRRHDFHPNHHHNNGNNDSSKDYPSDSGGGGGGGGSRSVTSPSHGGPAFFPVNQGNQVSESTIHRHDDFHSTSSAETGTGDSGHGSDDDMSNSLDHSNIPSVLMEQPIPYGDIRGGLGGSSRFRFGEGVSKPQYRVQKPSALKNPPNSKVKNNSVRFDPNVTDIYETNPTPTPTTTSMMHFLHQPANASTSSSPGVHSSIPQGSAPPHRTHTALHDHSQQKLPSYNHNHYRHHQHQQPHQQQHHEKKIPPPLPPPHPGLSNHTLNQRPSRGKDSLALVGRAPPRALPPFKQSSSMTLDDNNDDSDLNTTTSGSYSVASDDVARLSSLGAESRDLYV